MHGDRDALSYGRCGSRWSGRSFGRADENHDQIGRINRQVMDSCVILVGRTPRSLALSSLTHSPPSPRSLCWCKECSRPQNPPFWSFVCWFLCKRAWSRGVILTLRKPQLQLIIFRQTRRVWSPFQLWQGGLHLVMIEIHNFSLAFWSFCNLQTLP